MIPTTERAQMKIWMLVINTGDGHSKDVEEYKAAGPLISP